MRNGEPCRAALVRQPINHVRQAMKQAAEKYGLGNLHV